MTKTAFITGGTGFLGTNLIKALCEADWKVTALHRKTLKSFTKFLYLVGHIETTLQNNILTRCLPRKIGN